MTAKRCLIIGGSGFLGVNVAQVLAEAGHSVTILDPRPVNPQCLGRLPSEVRYEKGVYWEVDRLKIALKKHQIVFHFAHTSLPGTPLDRIEDDLRENVIGAITLLKAAHESGVELVVFPSSGGTVYGQVEHLPIPETAVTNPICFHGITKLMTEKYLQLFYELYGLEYLILRIANPYGPGQIPGRGQGLIATVLECLLKKKTIDVFGSDQLVRDYLYIDDLAYAFVLALNKNLRNTVCNIGSGRGTSIRDIIQLAAAICEERPQVIMQSARNVDVQQNVLDASRFCHATGWRPTTDLRSGIRQTYNWLKGFQNE